MCCPVCIGCDQWNDGEGSKACLGCAKIEAELPRNGRGRSGSARRREILMDPSVMERLNIPSDEGLSSLYHSYSSEHQDWLHTAIEKLDFHEKVLVLAKLSGNDISHMAKEFGWSNGKAWNAFKKATRKIKNFIEEEECNTD